MDELTIDIAAVMREEVQASEKLSALPNEGQRFVAWYLHRVRALDLLDALGALTDGASDKQIDAVHIDDEEGEIVVVQGKLHSRSKVTRADIGECLLAVSHLRDLGTLQQTANPALARKVPAIREAVEQDYTVVVELLTLGEIPQSAREDIYAYQQGLDGDGPAIELVPMDRDAVCSRYCQMERLSLPKLVHTFDLSQAQWQEARVNGTDCLLVILPLSQAIQVPGIDNGSLFRRNVRQALGKSTKVNRGLKRTLQSSELGDFFFYHNGITAICDSLEVDPEQRTLTVTGLNVVNGCQSLTTLLQNSEAIREGDYGSMLWRFYAIADPGRADRISTYTNSQNAVSTRDLTSNDRVQLLLKQRIEGAYPEVYFATKRGEIPPAGKRRLDSALFAKLSIAWDHWMPFRTHSEAVLFDRYYRVLFHERVDPQDVVPLFETYELLHRRWGTDLDIRSELRAKTSGTPYHVLTAMALLISAANQDSPGVPKGRVLALDVIRTNLTKLMRLACKCVQRAFEDDLNEAEKETRVLAVENWLKSPQAFTGARRIATTLCDLASTETDSWLTTLKLPSDMFRRRLQNEDD